MSENQYVEPIPYWVIHNEDTHLVSSKRVAGEKHSVAYSNDGKRGNNDFVRLRPVTSEEQKALSTHVDSSNNKFAQQGKQLAAYSMEKFGEQFLYCAADRACDVVFRWAGKGAVWAWPRIEARLANAVDRIRKFGSAHSNELLVAEPIEIEATVEDAD